MEEKQIAVIGLDTSHTVEFTKLIQSPSDGIRVVDGLRVVRAFRFPSAFQAEEGQDKRQAQLEELGVAMASSVDDAVAGADAVFIEINDPRLHLRYFEQVVRHGKPVFIDKPLASTPAEGRRIRALAEQHHVVVWSSSSLRFMPSLVAARKAVPAPKVAHAFGALGKAAAGSDLVWYGVHAVEMLVAGLGAGATSVHALEDDAGVVLRVQYADGRHGLIECLWGLYRYGGRLQDAATVAFFDSGSSSPYPALMAALRDFVSEKRVPVPLTDAQEVLAILDAGERSRASGRFEPLDA